jgi:hypothetical protein
MTVLAYALQCLTSACTFDAVVFVFLHDVLQAIQSHCAQDDLSTVQ